MSYANSERYEVGDSVIVPYNCWMPHGVMKVISADDLYYLTDKQPNVFISWESPAHKASRLVSFREVPVYAVGDVFTIDLPNWPGEYRVTKVKNHSYDIKSSEKTSLTGSGKVFNMGRRSACIEASKLVSTRYKVGDMISLPKQHPSSKDSREVGVVTEIGSHWFAIGYRRISWDSYTHTHSKLIAKAAGPEKEEEKVDLPTYEVYEVGDVFTIDLSGWPGEHKVRSVEEDYYKIDSARGNNSSMRKECMCIEHSTFVRNEPQEEVMDEDEFEAVKDALVHSIDALKTDSVIKEPDTSWKDVIVNEQTSSDEEKAIDVADTAHDLVDIAIEVEEARLQAEYTRKISRHRAKLRAIRTGVKPLGNWWNATIDMTPLSLAAIISAVVGVTALTVVLIPLVG